MARIAETWFRLKAFTSGDSASQGIVMDSDTMVANPQHTSTRVSMRCRGIIKIVIGLLLFSLVVAMIAVATDIKSSMANNKATTTQLRHVLKADEKVFSDFKASTAKEDPDITKQLHTLSVDLEQLKLESEAMKIALQYLTAELNATKADNAAMFRLVIQEANLTLCSVERGGRVVVPSAGVYRLDFFAHTAGASYNTEKLFSLQKNGEEVGGGSVLASLSKQEKPTKDKTRYVQRALLVRLAAGDSMAAVVTEQMGVVVSSRLCLARSTDTLPADVDSAVLA